MSIDPETLRQIEELSHDPRPLLVLDVDDVVLDFIGPFPRFLEKEGYELRLGSFRLNGNIFHLESGEEAGEAQVETLIENFFHSQADWQTITVGAAEAMAEIAPKAEIVMLTAMPHRFRQARRAHLDQLGLPYPVLTTEMAKGPAIKRLRGEHGRPIAFVDDQPRNLVSAHEWVSDISLFHLMADNRLREYMPTPPDYIHVVDDWQQAGPMIAESLGL